MSLLEKHRQFKQQLAKQPIYERAKVIPESPGPRSPGRGPGLATAGESNAPAPPTPRPLSAAEISRKYELNRSLLNITRFLRTTPEPQTIDQIAQSLGLDLKLDDELFKKVSSNTKIIFDPENVTFTYKPEHDVKSKQDLLDLLQRRRLEGGGMLVEDFKDSYLNIKEAMAELEKDGKILIVRKKDGYPRMLFYNDTVYNTPMATEFKELWNRYKMPMEAEMVAELEAAGHKTLRVRDSGPRRHETQMKRGITRTRKVKLTNTHLAGIVDLSKDYAPPGK